MVDRPRLSIDIYNQYVHEDGSVRWPDDTKEQALLARALFGREQIGKFDSWIKQAIDLLENPEPQTPYRRHNQAYLEDRYFREAMQTLGGDQKKAVRRLIQMTAKGLLFSTLVTLDQGDFGKYNLLLTPPETMENSNISLFSGLPDELHDELNDWIVSFSDFADEIVELVQHPQGFWQFQPKESS